MKPHFLVYAILLALLGPLARADEREDFRAGLDLEPLRLLSFQHQQTIKTMDSFARQALYTITGGKALKGPDALYTVLDVSFRPDHYLDQNVIYVRNVPLREDFRRLESIGEDEKERIVKTGLISLELWISPEVRELLRELESSAVFKARALQELNAGAVTLLNLSSPNLPLLRVVPPPSAEQKPQVWQNIEGIVGYVPLWVEKATKAGGPAPVKVTGYEDRAELLETVGMNLGDLLFAWRNGNAVEVNAHIQTLAQTLPQITPEVYPSELRRKVELTYNRLAKLTVPGAMVYFAAFVCFVVGAWAGVGGARLWGLRLMAVAFLIHTAGIGVRWWLVAGQHGNWFDGIPIKNQFESVLFSAWFGALVGLGLELRRNRGVFGAAASFFGWLSLLAIFATPYVTGKQIGGEIGHVNGVLMSYWLYLHVTLVVASYALIGMGFLLSAWWLVRYYMSYGTLRRVPARQLSSDAADLDVIPAAGGAATLGFARTLAMMLFIPRSPAEAAEVPAAERSQPQAADKDFLATLDRCNLVILQLAFLTLGVGIVLGAVWADQSWGRPWGWDPKETFALVTWIVYLIVVHVRLVTADKAWWTAVLGVVGFFVMLFNWIGVNFFLVGLHSYA